MTPPIPRKPRAPSIRIYQQERHNTGSFNPYLPLRKRKPHQLLSNPPSPEIDPILLELHARTEELDVTATSVANRAGLSIGGLNNWYRGQTLPILAAVRRLARALGYDIVLVKRETPEIEG